MFDQIIQPIRADQLTEAMRRDLLQGELGDGRLVIDALALRYGVSHMPVREALRELAGEGLVKLEANRGARAVPINASFVRQVFDTRIALEVMLTRAAARNVSQDAIAELVSIEDARLGHVAARAFDSAVAANARLHAAIYALAENAYAAALVDRHWRFIAALWARYGHAPDRFDSVADDHRHILAALAAQDGDAAGVLVAAHVTKAMQQLTSRMVAGEAP